MTTKKKRKAAEVDDDNAGVQVLQAEVAEAHPTKRVKRQAAKSRRR